METMETNMKTPQVSPKKVHLSHRTPLLSSTFDEQKLEGQLQNSLHEQILHLSQLTSSPKAGIVCVTSFSPPSAFEASRLLTDSDEEENEDLLNEDIIDPMSSDKSVLDETSIEELLSDSQHVNEELGSLESSYNQVTETVKKVTPQGLLNIFKFPSFTEVPLETHKKQFIVHDPRSYNSLCLLGEHEILRKLHLTPNATTILCRHKYSRNVRFIKQSILADARRPDNKQRCAGWDMIREAQAMAHLNHPHLPRWYGSWCELSEICLAYEYYPAGNLHSFFCPREVHSACITYYSEEERPSHLTGFNYLGVEHCLLLVANLLSLIVYMQRRGVVHGDLSASNVLLDVPGMDEDALCNMDPAAVKEMLVQSVQKADISQWRFLLTDFGRANRFDKVVHKKSMSMLNGGVKRLTKHLVEEAFHETYLKDFRDLVVCVLQVASDEALRHPHLKRVMDLINKMNERSPVEHIEQLLSADFLQPYLMNDGGLALSATKFAMKVKPFEQWQRDIVDRVEAELKRKNPTVPSHMLI